MPFLNWWSRTQTYFRRNSYTLFGTNEAVLLFFSSFITDSNKSLCEVFVSGLACCISQRYVFVFMGFLTVIIGSMMRLCLDLTFSHIVTTNSTKPVHYDPYSCPSLAPVNESDVYDKQINGTFHWSQDKQSSILGAYYFMYLIVQPIAGQMADSGGGKEILGYGLLIASITTMLTPFITVTFGGDGLLYMRYIVGAAVSPVIPVLFSMISKWVPKSERTMVTAIIFPGQLVGRVIAMYLTEVLLEQSSWKVVFYVIGSIGILWFIVWHVLVYSTPNDHPFISQAEKTFLNTNVRSLKRITERDLDPIPWSACIRSSALWGICAAYTAKEVALAALSVQTPDFLKRVYWYDITESKALTYLPYISVWISSVIFGLISTYFISKKIYSLKSIRKLFTLIGSIGSALVIVLIGYSNCQQNLVIIWMFLGTIALGSFFSGPIVGMLDICEDYAGTMVGNVDNIAVSFGTYMPTLSDYVVKNGLLTEYRSFFGLTTSSILVLAICCYLPYVQVKQLWWDDVRTHGYPATWKHGLLSAEAVIDQNGETKPKPRSK